MPALTLEYQGRELKAYGAMTAVGPVFQAWRVEWTGTKVPATLGETTVDEVLKRFWI